MNETQAAVPNQYALPQDQTGDPFAFGAASGALASQVQESLPVESIPQESIPIDGAPQQQKAIYAGIAVLALATLFGFYQIFVNDFSPLEAIINFFGGSTEATKPPSEVVQKKPKIQRQPAVEEDPLQAPVPGNPYWILPNANLTPASNLSNAVWSLEKEAAIRDGVSHVFVYQNFKAVQEVRRARWAGTEAILKQSLYAKKFWTRMFAAVGLAEMTFSVAITDLDKAIEGERSELVASFFQRFVDKPNPGQAYILRQVVRLADARARIVILEGIAKVKDDFSYLYLFAAAQDPNPKVKAKAQSYLKKLRVSSQVGSLAEQMVLGRISPQAFLKGMNVVDHAKFASDEVTVKKADDTEGKMLTEGDIDQAVNNFLNDPGDIEFLDEDPDAVDRRDHLNAPVGKANSAKKSNDLLKEGGEKPSSK